MVDDYFPKFYSAWRAKNVTIRTRSEVCGHNREKKLALVVSSACGMLVKLRRVKPFSACSSTKLF